MATLGLQAIHGIDHLFFQGRAVPVPVGALGVVESLAVGWALLLALRGDRRAPLAAALAGTFIAVAFRVFTWRPTGACSPTPTARLRLALSPGG